MTGWAALRGAGLALRNRHRTAFAAPEAAQRKVLREVLGALHASRFADDHDLHPDMPLEAFRNAVPVRTYADFQPWLDALMAGEGTALTGAPPVAFELTGGSSGGRKPVPMTPALLNGFRRGLIAWLGDMIATWPGIARGRSYFALSPALRHAPDPIGAWPVGLPSDLAYFGEEYAPHLAPNLLFTPQIAAISDPDDWRTATLALLLGARDLSLVSVWSPTFLTLLLDSLAADPDKALRALADGIAGLPPDPDRADELSKLESLTPGSIWPNLALVSAWADASAARPFSHLSDALPGVALQGKGLLATEGLFTLPFTAFDDPVPAILSGLLEFRDEGGACHLMQDLSRGATYDLIVSPIGGFARYAIGDRVQCTGWACDGVPMLRFVGRGSASSDLVGEKLTEAFVLGCLQDCDLSGVLAARAGPPPRYDLVSGKHVPPEALRALDAALCQNPQYAYARELGQLDPPGQVLMADLEQRLTRQRLNKGHRLSDIKPPVLLSPDQFSGLLDVN